MRRNFFGNLGISGGMVEGSLVKDSMHIWGAERLAIESRLNSYQLIQGGLSEA